MYQRFTDRDLVMSTGIDQDALDARVRRDLQPIALGLVIGFLVVLLASGAIGGLVVRRMELDRLTRTDELTSTLNRRGVMERLEIEMARSVRTKASLSLLMLDIDHFKRINDQWGHATGDAALRAFSKAVRQVLRDSDHMGRVGGEEFLVIAPDTAQAGAKTLAERILEAVRQCQTIRSPDGQVVSITTSIGVSVLSSGQAAMDRAMAAADAALYQAKATGRNRTVVAELDAQPA